MEALMWRASNVVISYGAIRVEAAGGASGTQEKEKKSGSSSKGSFEKARLGEKSPAAAAAAAATTSGNNGRGFALAPLPFTTAKNLVPAPLRFLWFPETAGGKNTEEPSSDNSSSGKGAGKDVHTKEIDDYLEEGREQEEDVSQVSGDEKTSDDVPGELMELGPDLEDSFEADRSPTGESEGSVDRSVRFEDAKVSRRWYQFILTGSFLKKSPSVQVRVPSTISVENSDQSMTSSGSQTSSIQMDLDVETLQQAAGASAACALGDAKDCIGCSSESENYVVDPASSSPLATLEVPHVNVTHDLESFSKFLSEVPLTELKIIAQSSFLSNLAYVIPEIKAGELAKYHRMLFVTSSVDIKAAALAKEKAEALAQEKAAAAAKSELDRKEAGSKPKETSYLSPETAYALAAAATSFLRSQKKGSLVPSPGEEASAAHEDDAKLVVDREIAQTTDSLGSDSFAVFMGGESNDSQSQSAELSAQDMPVFMRPVTSVVSAEKDAKEEVANNLRSLHTCPCEWFSCDEKSSRTRIFSIQGSESFSSWQANLLFEPIPFEGSNLGVMVHRGIYEAALGLYEQILPYVFEHEQRYGERAKFRFTGHSLGGSLAVLLTLMLNIRGVVKTESLLPVYAFGAPYILCGGDYLLQKLGLPLTHVQYIVMHRDIVPRTFTCNYPDHVAEVLKRVNGIFRDHSCLTRQRLLYAPMGQLMILQPDQGQASPHPLLPSGSGLYLIRHESHNEPDTVPSSDREVVPSRAVQVRAAQRAFLNLPHPLEIISDPGAYGSEGTIAKHHDPRNYSKAINKVLRQETRRWRRVQRERRRQLWWPLVSADAASAIAKGASLGVQKEQGALKGVTRQGMCGPSGLSHFVSDLGACRATFPVSVLGARKGRCSSLIASQHVQMGLVVLVTAKLFIEQGFGVVLAWV